MAKIVNPTVETAANIKVIGIGGSGKNALNHMVESNVKGVEFIAINTDTQDLHNCLADKKIHIGKNLTRGLGAGMDPEVGRKAAEETKEEITEAIKGADMVFITGGLGGGTFTGASSVVASICKNEGILTIAVATKPFFFEGSQRGKIADEGLEALEKEVDALITIPNDRLLSVAEKNTTITQAFAMCDEVLKQSVEGISEIIRLSGRMNLDFNDIRRVLKDSGTALFGMGRASGDTRAVDAANISISNPLLDVSINNATGLLYVIFGNSDLTLAETADASRIITESVAKDAKIIFGVYNDESLKKDEVKVTVIATGFPNGRNNNTLNSLHSLSSGLQKGFDKSSDKSFDKNFDRGERGPVIAEIEKEENHKTSFFGRRPDPIVIEDSRIENTIEDNNHNIDNKDRDNNRDRRDNKIINTKPIDLGDEEDDWGSLPPFLQRKRK